MSLTPLAVRPQNDDVWLRCGRAVVLLPSARLVARRCSRCRGAIPGSRSLCGEQTSGPGIVFLSFLSVDIGGLLSNILSRKCSQRTVHQNRGAEELPRSLYSAQNTPLVSITARNPAITVSVGSSSTN
jgi:hypothetical protein